MKKRMINIDIIRVIAVLFVVYIHFLLNIGFYDELIISPEMIIMNSIRIILITCVPLFLLITGYLMHEKVISKDYYKGIWKVIGLYLIISLESFIFSKYYLGQENLTFSRLILGMFDFSNNPYSWYVKMYIGLYFMIPFFNLTIKSIDKTNFKILLATLITITVIPTALNIFNLNSFSQFIRTNVVSETNMLVTDYWLGLWPITYYFTGAYLKKFPPSIRPIKSCLAIIICTIIFSIFNISRNYGFKFFESLYVQFYGFQTYIISVLIFLCINNIKVKTENRTICRIISFISKHSFGLYLSSYIIDTIVYQFINSKIININEKIHYFIIVPSIVFVLSLLLSCLSYYFQQIIKLAFIKIKKVKKGLT